MTVFTFNGKTYHWKGHTALVEDDYNVAVAVFHSTWFDPSLDKIGSLEITSAARNMTDVIIITALIMHERSDEGRQAVQPSE
jgi:hypothetical protein